MSGRIRSLALLVAMANGYCVPIASGAESGRSGGANHGTAPIDFPAQIQPLLERYCFDCHGHGSEEGGLALDRLAGQITRGGGQPQWLAVWKNLRAQIMPPSGEMQPSPDERQLIARWIEQNVVKLDPANPDPGRVTIRRLNRQEYQNTIYDLFGVTFDATDAFPPDDTGYGFDTIGDVLSLSPLLMEKYLDAAQVIIEQAVRTDGPRIPTRTISGDQFRSRDNQKRTAHWLPFGTQATVSHIGLIEQSGRYQIRVEMQVLGSMAATSQTADVVLRANEKELDRSTLSSDYRKSVYLTAETKLEKGDQKLALELIPKGTPQQQGEDPRRLHVRMVELNGPLDGSYLQYRKEYDRVFLDGPPPTVAADREAYARKILRHFADRAFRRPVDQPTLDRLVTLFRQVEQQPDTDFDDGIAHALTAILISPRFLFRAEAQAEPDNPGRVVLIDQYALAARLSYFLWSSLPDDELRRLAQEGKLRDSLHPQVDRMLDDPRSDRFVQDFVGQWLQTRDVETINIDARRILGVRSQGDASRTFNAHLRRAMREETEMLFEHLLRENGSVLDLLTADYTFLNESLARFYGIPDVEGDQMRKVALTPQSHRGGILTHASFLVVTSNPTRTSPVKRGLFVLENLLGTPPPPPPADVPDLEESKRGMNRNLTMREMMAIHRDKPLCASCHARMDPLGLALENYNALGMWRDKENGKPIETRGELNTGEKFANAQELARVLTTQRRHDFYRCLAEKMLTFAIGRGVEYYDWPTVDQFVEALEQDSGKIRTLIHAIVDSAPFQKRRGDGERLSAERSS